MMYASARWEEGMLSFVQGVWFALSLALCFDVVIQRKMKHFRNAVALMQVSLCERLGTISIAGDGVVIP